MSPFSRNLRKKSYNIIYKNIFKCSFINSFIFIFIYYAIHLLTYDIVLEFINYEICAIQTYNCNFLCFYSFFIYYKYNNSLFHL